MKIFGFDKAFFNILNWGVIPNHSPLAHILRYRPLYFRKNLPTDDWNYDGPIYFIDQSSVKETKNKHIAFSSLKSEQTFDEVVKNFVAQGITFPCYTFANNCAPTVKLKGWKFRIFYWILQIQITYYKLKTK